MADYGYIYKTTNLKEGKVYIGQNKGEFYPYYYGSGLHIKRAINKYGRESFKLELIAYLPNREQLNEFEKFLISKYREILGRDKLYNIQDGGEGHSGNHILNCNCCSCKNKRGELIYTEERNKKISETKKKMARKGLYSHSEEVRRKIGLSAKGRKLSEESKEKLRQKHLGKKLSEEHKKNIGIARTGISRKAHKFECKCIVCIRTRNKNVCKC